MEEDIKILSDEEIEKNLIKVPGWKREGDKIVKQFGFRSFEDGIDFIKNLTPFFNKIDHHPDLHIYYKKITFELTRYSVGGKITERDFLVAEEIEKAFKEYSNLKM